LFFGFELEIDFAGFPFLGDLDHDPRGRSGEAVIASNGWRVRHITGMMKI
jgi:hypothetical protein